MWYDVHGNIKVGSVGDPAARAEALRDITAWSERTIKEAGGRIFEGDVVELDRARALRGKPPPEIVRQAKIAEQSRSIETPAEETRTLAQRRTSPRSNGCGNSAGLKGATSGGGALVLGSLLLFRIVQRLIPQLTVVSLALDDLNTAGQKQTEEMDI